MRTEGLAILLLALALAGPASAERPVAPLATPGPSQVLKSRLARIAAGEVPLRVPEGFRVRLYAEGLSAPREMVSLPSGDLLVVESSAGRVARLGDHDGNGVADDSRVWADGLDRPYGIAVQRGFVYVACRNSVLRFPLGEHDEAGALERVVPRLEYDGQEIWQGGHWTRDILFSADGRHFFLSVGSRSNNDDGEPAGRAAILRYPVGGGKPTLYATGLRNPVSITWRPGTQEMWVTVNERDRLGNDLVPDYVTSVKENGFYGWPYYYIGPNPDPRHAGKRPDLAAAVIVPDVLIQAHSATLGLTFYDARQFPAEYRGNLFVGLHGSWNRDPLVGYKVIAIPFRDGRPGQARDFLTGFVKDAATGEVYGRPVAPFVAADGSLLVSDDEAGRLWRIVYEGEATPPSRKQ